MNGAAPAVRLRRLTKRYGRRVALNGVDLELAGREIVAVVGPDGAGKTTLLRTLAGLLEVEAEEATVLGFDLRRDVTELKARIGYVPQTFSLPRELSVMENLRFTARLHRLDEEDFAARSRELLERTALAPFTDRPAGKLSGGMKQKLAIVNALLVDPELVLLDEPTAGVDILARAEIGELLTRAKERSLVVVSTSYLDEAEAADRLVYLDDGRVLASGDPDTIRERVPIDLYRLWGDDPRALAEAARALSWVVAARASGRFARVEIARTSSPPRREVLKALNSLPGAAFSESVVLDMEAALVALAREAA
jgi:ABC-type multidrug transport system ATPase subunit